MATTHPPTTLRGTSWATYVTGIWSAVYAVLATGWLAGLGGYPFDPDPDGEGTALLDRLPQAVGAAVLLALALAGLVVSVGLARPRSGAWAWRSAFGLAAVLTIVLPDYRVLATVAYLPIILVLVVSGHGDPQVLHLLTSWNLMDLVVLMLVGVSFAHAALERRRAQQQRCAECGIPTDPQRRVDPVLVRRWGRIATYVAIAVPVFYAVTRLAWFAGVPLGLTSRTYAHIQDILPIGAALGTMALGGAVLTLGLLQHWGEVFPRWIPVLRGKRVPIKLAVVPALAVSVLVVCAGLMFIRLALTGAVSDSFAFMTMRDWSAWVPELLWPLWGVALATAAFAYRARRLPTCVHHAAVMVAAP